MKKGFQVHIQQSNQPFEDMQVPLNKRAGFNNANNWIVPTYFCRQMGIPSLEAKKQAIFYNQLFLFHDKWSNSQVGYARIEQGIPVPTNDEVDRALTLIHAVSQNRSPNLRDKIVNAIILSKVIQNSVHSSYLDVGHKAFETVIDMFITNESTINESKLENFSLKLAIWLSRFSASLFPSAELTEPPKVLYYGDIKKHEVYFLEFLAMMGMDVLYVHTDSTKDVIFEQIERGNKYSQRIELAFQSELKEFPLVEQLVEKHTVAYNASKEIEQVLYGADVGLFKPWQFEGGTTKSLLLRTTYDELKILWEEEAKFRPEFKVDGSKVYVPNIFAKINGTQENLQSYWNDFTKVSSTKNTVVATSFPLMPTTYSKKELYASDFLFTKEGMVDKHKLVKSELYKLHYLKDSLQAFIINKINELLISDVFKQGINEKYRLKILMTIITMNPSYMRLVEGFDFTGYIPKLVIYSNGRDLPSEEDTILLAFFKLVGIDVVIFTPTNYNNIENTFHSTNFQVHQLPSVHYDLEIPTARLLAQNDGKKSWWRKIWEKLVAQ